MNNRGGVKDLPISAQSLPAFSWAGLSALFFIRRLCGGLAECFRWSPRGKPVAPRSFADSLRERRDLVSRHPDRQRIHPRLKPGLARGRCPGFSAHWLVRTVPKDDKSRQNIQRGITVGTIMMRTSRATKLRAKSLTDQSALVADLTCIRRIDKGDCQAVSLCSISYALNHQIVAKAVKLASCSFSYPFFFRSPLNTKVFKYEHGIFRSPLAQFSRSLSTKRFCLITLFLRQTFQDATHSSCVFAQFLFRRFF